MGSRKSAWVHSPTGQRVGLREETRCCQHLSPGIRWVVPPLTERRSSGEEQGQLSSRKSGPPSWAANLVLDMLVWSPGEGPVDRQPI